MADLEKLEVPKDLFKDVKYYLVGTIDKKVEELLNNGGGKRDHYLSEMCSHAVADDPSEADCSEARELFELPVVTSRWVILSVKCGCLLPTEGFSPEENRLFSGVVACPSQISGADREHMWAMLSYNGAHCQRTFTHDVTHLIAAKPGGPKYECALRHPERVKVVTPDWVSECLNTGQLLDETRFHPRLLLYEIRENTPSPVPMDEEESTASATPSSRTAQLVRASASGTPLQPAVRPPTTGAVYNYHPHSPKTNSRTKEALARMVSNRIGQTSPGPGGSGSASHSPERPQAPPPPAPMPPQMPGAPMLRPMMPGAHGAGMRSPRGMLRNMANDGHTPRMRSPRGGPRGPRGPRSPRGSRGRGSRGGVSHLGYGRGGRGGMFGTALHHHQLQAQQHQLQQQKQQQQPLSVYFGHDPVETVPPEACLLGCVFYITDYQKHVDEATIAVWKQVIIEHGGAVDASYSQRVTHVLCEHQRGDVYALALRDRRRLVTAHWLNDTLLRRKLMPPWLALHFPLMWTHTERPLKDQIICATNFYGEERLRLKQMIACTGAKYTGYMTHANSVLIARKPEGTKYQKANEWRIPVVNTTWLNDILLGDLSPLKTTVNSRHLQFVDEPFKLDLWRVAHLLEGWKTPIRISKEAWKQFKANPSPKSAVAAVNPSMPPPLSHPQKRKAEEETANPASKRQKTDENEAPAKEGDGPVVLLTGLPKSKALQLAKEVERLGGTMTSQARGATHLVARSVARTVKFLTGLSVVKHVLSPAWLEKSAQEGRFLDEKEFVLEDSGAEAEFSFSFAKSLERARSKKVFEGLSFFMTPGVIPGKATLEEIIVNAGGKMLSAQPKINTILNSKNAQGDPTYIIITCENDLFLCENMMSKDITVHNAEFILTGVMKQEVSYEAYRMG